MRVFRSTAVLALALACAGAVLAQVPSPKPGTKVRVQLKTRLGSKKSIVGEKVRAQIKQEIKQGHTVLLPKNGYLLGEVTEVVASDHGSAAKVGVLFNEVTDKKGNVIAHLRGGIIHISAGSTNYSQISVPTEMGGSGMPVAGAGVGGALTSANRSSNGIPLGFGLMESYNGSGTDLGGVMMTQKGNFHLDQGTTVQVEILKGGN
ncbi:MAG: hypothetical protein ACRD04_07105 [Terriglobales bacterium]